MNISKKTSKKIQAIIRNHFDESGSYVTSVGWTYLPASDSPLSAIWKKIVVKFDGKIIGYLLDDKCKYMVAGSVARRRVAQTIKSPEQFFHPRCYFARQSKQIARRLRIMGEDKLAHFFDGDAIVRAMINAWNGELDDSDYTFLMQDLLVPVLEGECK